MWFSSRVLPNGIRTRPHAAQQEASHLPASASLTRTEPRTKTAAGPSEDTDARPETRTGPDARTDAIIHIGADAGARTARGTKTDATLHASRDARTDGGTRSLSLSTGAHREQEPGSFTFWG